MKCSTLYLLYGTLRGPLYVLSDIDHWETLEMYYTVVSELYNTGGFFDLYRSYDTNIYIYGHIKVVLSKTQKEDKGLRLLLLS